MAFLRIRNGKGSITLGYQESYFEGYLDGVLYYVKFLHPAIQITFYQWFNK